MEAHPIKASALIGRLWREALSRYKLDLVLLAPVLAVVALAAVSYAAILKFTVDYIEAGDLAAIGMVPVAVIAATCVRALAIWTQAVLAQGLSLKVLRDLQNAMFEKLVRADYARFAREDSGKLVSRFTNDVTIIGEGLVRGAQVAIRDTLTLIGAIASMLWFDWALTLVVFAVFALAAAPLSAIAKRARAQTQIAQAQIGALTALLSETFAAARFVKTYQLEARETGRARAGFEARRAIAMKLARNRARSEPVLEVLGGLALAGVLYAAGVRITSGAMSLGDLVAMIGAIGVATPAARAVGNFNTVLNEALGALSRVFALIDEAPSIVDRADAKPLTARGGAIKFEQVSFSYGAAPALDGVSFAIEPGARVALVGASGAGKSTVFHLLTRLYDVSAGGVTIDGQDVRAVTMESLRAAIALVAQEAVLFNDTIGANIALGRPDAPHEDIVAAAKAAAAHDFITALPAGYDTLAGERGQSLSGGERQRIALARAFLRDAPILLLDEATSALDASSEALVQEALERLTKGRTTLIIAHRLSTIRNCDRILVFDKGAIVEAGAHDELMSLGGVYARLSAQQFASSNE